MSNTEKKVKPLKKIKTIKKQKEEQQRAIKPAVRIQELKNKLIILAHELKVDKKINDTLYRKMQLLTYSRTTEQKLKDSYKTLKNVDNDIKQTATTQGEKLKKKTLKDFKENKKIIDDDKNVLPGTYLIVRWEILNATIQAYGKTNIIDEIKSFIDVTMSAAYTYKIKILDVHVNKEIYQPKQYRYLGAERSYDKKKHKGYIKYFKAWNATFNYKGFNLDMNNDIAFECVPNALFKTYGTKKEKSNQYLHSIHKGGLDYVKN